MPAGDGASFSSRSRRRSFRLTMSGMIELVRGEALLRLGGPVVVMYSGGRDSTCLLDLAVRIAGRGAVSAMHVNYGLRAASDADERHCAATCRRLGVPLHVRRPQAPAAGNVQDWARSERYQMARAIAAELDADIAAGHTATDQVETILYRLASSPSRRALLGMVPRDGRLIRPLLSLTREQTAGYCRARGLDWREDESNATPLYARNRVRAGLLERLREIHPGADDNVLALARTLREEQQVLDDLIDQALAGRREIAVAELRALPEALARLVVQRLADDALGRLAPGAGRWAGELAGLGDRGTVERDLGYGLRALSEYGILRIERRLVAGTTAELAEPVVLPIPGRAVFGSSEVRCELGPPEPSPGVLDRSLLGPELLVRGWRPGDRMRPLGLGGSKSLQDLFTARRVPREQRRSLAVVESGGEIAWVAGVATSELFKVGEHTCEAVHLSVVAGLRPYPHS
jgi:tRNA(Ile)-lysidine synthase